MYNPKDKTFILSNFQNGVAQSAFLGFENIQNIEVFDEPGIAKLASRTTSLFSVSNMPIAYRKDVYGNEYVLTSSQGTDWKVYKNNTLLHTGSGTAWDMEIWNDYLFVSYSSGGSGYISLYGPLSSGGASWFTSWKSGLNGNYCLKLEIRRDGLVMYIANGNSVASLSSFSGGTPSVSPTSTLDTSAVRLPSGQYATTLLEVGAYLFIGSQAGSNWYDRVNYKLGNILIWDKTTGGTLSNQVELNENGVHAMVSDGNRIFVSAGVQGNIYQTDSVNYRKIKTLPWCTLRGFSQKMAGVYPNAMSFNHNGNLLIGTSSNTGVNQRFGVWEINTSTGKYETVLKHTISSGNIGLGTQITIGLVNPTTQDVTLIGWQDGTSYGLDTTDERKSQYAVIESEMAIVGSRLQRTTFQQLEFCFARPLVSGQSISVYYRKEKNNDYTLIGTFDYSTIGAVSSFVTKALIGDAEKLQIKIVPTQDTSVLSNLELIYLKIW